DFYGTASAQEFGQDEQQVITTGTPVIAKEEREVWPDGNITWAATTTLPMRDAGGRVVGIVGVTRDITSQKRAEEELRTSKERLERLVEENARLLDQVRRSEEKYRALFEHAIEGIFQTSPEGHYLTANPALAHMHGYDSPEELMAKVTDVSQRLYVDPADRANFIKIMHERGEVRDFQFRALRKDGAVIWVSENAHAVRDAAGNLLYYEGTSQDITERRRAEEALRASEARYQSLVENLAQAVFLKDTEFRLVAVNKPFCAWLGMNETDLLGKSDFDLFPEHLARQYRADDEYVVRSGQRIDQEEDNLRGSDLRSVHVVKSPIRDDQGHIIGVLGSFWDVTDQKRLEAQLRQSQKMDAIGQLAGGIAHDFNNLLTAIIGNLGMLLSETGSDDPRRELLEAAEQASSRAAELTHQLLGFSRQTLLQLRPMSLAGCLQEVADILRRTFDPRISFEMRVSPGLWTALVDPGQIVQVLMNLCLNARDAMPEGGKLLLETENLAVDEEYARLHIDARPGEFVRLRVQDSGHGITPEVQPRIFEPFFTTKPPGQGTGLGLAMVFGIVKQHGGWIGCYSEVGHGTCFDVYLPRHAVNTPASLPVAEAPEPAGGSETVLLVDDEPLVRNLGQKILHKYGYRVLTAEDGRMALDVYRQHRQQIDLVILDLTMPHLSGRDTAEALQLIDPDVRVLFSSGYSAEQLSDDGAVHFVHKPYRPRDLARLVRSILGQPRTAGT
ncbi:MAG: PAS domain S-box protein, partial [Gemmataceae bacterium]